MNGNIALTEAQFQQLLQAVQRSGSTIPTTIFHNSTATCFTLSPALINQSKSMNFSVSEGAKLNKSAIENLSFKFHQQQSMHLMKCSKIDVDPLAVNKGDAEILTIPTLNLDLNIIKDFGQISMDEIKSLVAIYINEESRKV